MKQLQITITLDVSNIKEELYSCQEISDNLKKLFIEKELFEELEVIDIKTNKLNF